MTDRAPTPSAAGRSLVLIAIAELLAMSLWFSATAVAPELAATWGLSPEAVAWLTIAVQVGFVTGALLSAALTVSDFIRPRHLFAGCAFFGAACTVAIASVVDTAPPAIGLRFLTGMALAGVYPPAMKMMAGWFRLRRGFAIGVLVGALTVGSALPHLLRGLGGVGAPRLVLYGSSVLAAFGGLVILTVDEGPYQPPTAPFDPRAVGRILRDRGTVLANLGYFGHMWELYAVWTWIPVYLAASFAASGHASPSLASVVAFATIAVGGVGAVGAGLIADRVGRTVVTSVSLVASGLACLLAGVAFGGHLWVIVPFVLSWGIVVVADSAQFSACVTELAEAPYVGTALTLQTALGFLLTTISIQLIPIVAEVIGWRWAFSVLVVGPAFGTAAMLRLRLLPEAGKLAGGRR